MTKVIRQLLAAAATIALLIVGVQLIGTSAASAHSNSVSGQPTCQADGTYTVVWTITNLYTGTDVITIDGFAPAGSVLSSSTFTLGAHGSGSVNQTQIPGNATAATLTNVHGDWTDPSDPWQADSGPVTVSLPGTCLPAHTAVAPTWANGACVKNVVNSPTVHIPSDAGVSYALDGKTLTAGDYPTAAGPHTIVASSTTLTLAPPTEWDFTLTEAPGDCGTVTPLMPTVTQTRCANHAPTPPTIVFAATRGVTYSANKSRPFSPGETVVVTATAAKGLRFDVSLPGWPSGWTVQGPRKATISIVLKRALNCGTAATPTTPSVTQSACQSGSTTPTAPTITFPNTTGVTYSTNKPSPFHGGQTILVTATAQKGYYFGSAPSGWTRISGKVLTQKVHLTKLAPHQCWLSVKVTKVGFTPSQCVSGQPKSGTYTIPRSTGVVYRVNGEKIKPGTYSVASNTTVTVVATAKTGYKLVGQKSFTHTFGATPQCANNKPQHIDHAHTTQPNQLTNTAAPNQLANTGVPTERLISLGLALMVLGALSLLLAARRRDVGR